MDEEMMLEEKSNLFNIFRSKLFDNSFTGLIWRRFLEVLHLRETVVIFVKDVSESMPKEVGLIPAFMEAALQKFYPRNLKTFYVVYDVEAAVVPIENFNHILRGGGTMLFPALTKIKDLLDAIPTDRKWLRWLRRKHIHILHYSDGYHFDERDGLGMLKQILPRIEEYIYYDASSSERLASDHMGLLKQEFCTEPKVRSVFLLGKEMQRLLSPQLITT